MKTYFHHLYHADKKLFIIISLFSLGTGVMTILGDQVTPFYIWGMFSEPIPVRETYSKIQLEADGKPLEFYDLQAPNRHLLYGGVHFYKKIKDNKNTHPTRTFFRQKLGVHYNKVQPILENITCDSSDFEAAEEWIQRYLSYSISKDVKEWRAIHQEIRFNENNRPEVVSTQTILP